MFKFVFVFAFAFAFLGLSGVEASFKKDKREVATEEPSQLENVQQQLMTAFDGLKKSVEEFGAKFTTDDLVQGFQNLTAKLEGYAKMAAEQVSSYTAQATKPEEKKEEAPAPAPTS